MTLSPGELMRTYDGKFSMPQWWDLAEKAQARRGKNKLLTQFVCGGDLVFDVGANRGVMTYTFRQLGCVVVSIEPLFAAAPRLVREFQWKFNSDPHVIQVDQAMSDKSGAVQIAVQKNLPYLSSCSRPWMTESAHAKMYAKKAINTVSVKSTTFDELIKIFGVPDFIKLDVEGYGGTAIRGLSEPVNALSFEFHQDWLHDTQATMRHLDLLGRYEYNYALDNRGILVLDEWKQERNGMIEHLKKTLTKKGRGSWGDVYARLKSG